MKMLVAYDGTIQSKDALRFGLEKAREKGAMLAVLQVFKDSLFIDYGAGPAALGAAREESERQLGEARAIIKEEGKGVKTAVFTVDGDPEEQVLGFAESERVDMLLCTPKYKGIARRYAAGESAGMGSGSAVVYGVGGKAAGSWA